MLVLQLEVLLTRLNYIFDYFIYAFLLKKILAILKDVLLHSDSEYLSKEDEEEEEDFNNAEDDQKPLGKL